MKSKISRLEHPSGISVELMDTMNDDLAIVNAARVSYGKETSCEPWYHNKELQQFMKLEINPTHSPISPEDIHYCLSKKDEGVLNYLMKNRHGTPFEMVQFQFRVRAPIGVIWEWVRHRISSYNIKSTRYVEWAKEYYVPEASEWRMQIGKPGHYEYVTIEDPIKVAHLRKIYVKAMEDAFFSYDLLVEGGLAKEVARNVLPMGAMTEMIWSVNLRSLLNFLSLRTAPDALLEIQIASKMVEQLAEDVVPYSISAWRKNEKRAP